MNIDKSFHSIHRKTAKVPAGNDAGVDRAGTLDYKVAPRTPLQFVEDDDLISEKIAGKKVRQRRRHIVLFYEEPEYAALISFKYIKSGLEIKNNCGYVSKDAHEMVRNEIVGNPVDFDKLQEKGVLKVVQFQDLSSYPKGSKKGLQDIASLLRDSSETPDAPGSPQVVMDRTVLKCMHRVSMRKDILTNMALERQHRINFEVFGETSLLVTYPVKDILSTARGKRGVHSRWMELLVKKYDSVIFAYSLMEGGIALNMV